MDEVLIRELKGYQGMIIGLLAAAFSGFYLYTSIFGMVSGETHRGFFVLGSFVLTFLLYPAREGKLARPTLVDILLSFITIIAVFYWILEYSNLHQRLGWETLTSDLIVGGALIVLSLEAARRTTGKAIPILAILGLLYAYLGPYFPGILGHQGFTLERIIEYLFVTSDGIFGLITDTFATYVFIFIVFGAFLVSSGLGNLFINLSYALTGKYTGGPALTAVMGSGVMGSITGSPNANVATTGVFTIPLMKKVGYKPTFAAATEASASTGGAYMPPLMGAAAFIIAETTGTPYIEIVAISIVPALLYFLSVGVFVYLEARKNNLRGLPKEELPSIKKMVKKLYLLLPIPLLVYLLFIGFTPFYAASIALLASVAISWISKDTRMGLRSIINSLIDGAKNILPIGSLVGTLGIILGMALLTGLPNRFSGFLLELSGGSLPLVIIIVILAGYVIGMGLPITPAYILVSLFCVPALTELGISTLTAHMIAFWVSVNSVVTPPVALAAYAAAAIAKADFLKTAFLATKLASWLYLMPFLFVYTPLLSLNEIAFHQAVSVIISSLVGAVAYVFAVQGYMIRKIHWIMRLVLLGTFIILLHPSIISDLIGFLIVIAFFIYQKWIPNLSLGKQEQYYKGGEG